MNLPAKTYGVEFGDVLTVSAPGLYVFFKYDVQSGPGLSVLVNGVDISLQPDRVVYLKTGDVVTHTGSAGKLAGVRLGDELAE